MLINSVGTVSFYSGRYLLRPRCDLGAALNGLALPANVKEDVGQELEACTEGLWFMSENPAVVPPTYPLYMVRSCRGL